MSFSKLYKLNYYLIERLLIILLSLSCFALSFPRESWCSIVASSTQASDPLQTGVKERASQLSLGDFIYSREYHLGKPAPDAPAPQIFNHPMASVSWSANLQASVCGSVAFDGDAIVFSSYDQRLWRLHKKHGSLITHSKLWSQPVGNPVVHRKMIIIPQRNGNITAFALPKLQRVWNSRSSVYTQADQVDLSISGISLSNPYLYVSKHWGNLYILKAKDGQMLADPGVPYESRIAIPAQRFGERVVYTNVAGEILCFSADGRKQHWIETLPEGYLSSMIIHNDILYGTTTMKKLIAFDLQTRRLLWEKPLRSFAFESVAIHQNRLIVCAGDVYAFSWSGELIWQWENRNPWGACRGASILLGTNLWFAQQEGGLYAIDSQSGKLQQHIELPFSADIRNPISSDGQYIAVSSTAKELALVNIRP